MLINSFRKLFVGMTELRRKCGLLLTVLAVLSFSGLVIAEDAPQYDRTSVVKAVVLASQVDAFDQYCETDRGGLAESYIKKFAHAETDTVRDALSKASQEAKQDTLARLNETKPECKTPDFLMQQFKVMTELKEVSGKLMDIDITTHKLTGEELPEVPEDGMKVLEELQGDE